MSCYQPTLSQFTPSTAVDIAIYRQSRWGKWAEHVVAECSALGIDFLDIGELS